MTNMLFASKNFLKEKSHEKSTSTSTRSRPEVAALEQRLAEAHSEHERAEQRHGDVTVHLKAQLRDLQVPRKAMGKCGDSSSSFSRFWKNQMDTGRQKLE